MTIPRCGFTAILNGKHHLEHNDYLETLAKDFDLIVFVEGACKPHGSTAWCKTIPDKWHNNGRSIDETVEYLERSMKKNKNIILIKSNGLWDSKDEMENIAIDEIRKKYDAAMLWKVDPDEQWRIEDRVAAEKDLERANGKTGCFCCNCFCGKNIIARGEWGEGDSAQYGYRRLWRWNGERLKISEPMVFVGDNKPFVNLPQRFNHYAYYFREDVEFKADFYSNMVEDAVIVWDYMQLSDKWPKPITALITGGWKGRFEQYAL